MMFRNNQRSYTGMLRVTVFSVSVSLRQVLYSKPLTGVWGRALLQDTATKINNAVVIVLQICKSPDKFKVISNNLTNDKPEAFGGLMTAAHFGSQAFKAIKIDTKMLLTHNASLIIIKSKFDCRVFPCNVFLYYFIVLFSPLQSNLRLNNLILSPTLYLVLNCL